MGRGKKDVSYVSAAPLGTFPLLSITFGNNNDPPPPALAHTKKKMKQNDTTPLQKRKKRNTVIGSLSLLQNFSTPLFCRARPPQHCVGARSDRGEHTPYLCCLVGPEACDARRNMWSLSVNLLHGKRQKKEKKRLLTAFFLLQVLFHCFSDSLCARWVFC